MRNALKATMIASALLATAGMAHAQQQSTVTSQHISTPEHTIKLEIRDGVATMTHNGDNVRIPSLDGDWTTHDIIGEDGRVICTLKREKAGDHNISVTVAGMPEVPGAIGTPRVLTLERAPRVRAALPAQIGQAQLPGLATSPEQPKVMLGVRLDVSLDDDELAQFGINSERASRINFLIDGAPAKKAGLKVGDILVGIGDRDSGNIDAIRAALKVREPGDTVKVVLLRDGEKITKKVRLTAFQDEPVVAFLEPNDRDDVRRQLDDLSRSLDQYKAKLAASQEEIATIRNPEKLRAAADEIQRLALKIAELSRDRAEMLAQIEMQAAQRQALILGEADPFWSNQNHDEELRRFHNNLRELELRDELGRGLGGGFFIQRGGEDGPMIIERRLDLEDMLPDNVQELVEGFVDGRWEDMASDLVEELEDVIEIEIDSLLEENGFGDLDDLMDQAEDELEEVEDRFEELEDRFDAMEDRLERIEKLLRSLLESE